MGQGQPVLATCKGSTEAKHTAIYLKNMFSLIYLESKEEAEIDTLMREKHQWAVFCTPLLGMEPTAQASALTGTGPANSGCTGQHSANGATRARAKHAVLIPHCPFPTLLSSSGTQENPAEAPSRLVRRCPCTVPASASWLAALTLSVSCDSSQRPPPLSKLSQGLFIVKVSL